MTDLIDQYRELHRTRVYGASSARFAPYLFPHIQDLAPHSVVDFGCGQSVLPDLVKASGVPDVTRYDPAVPAYAKRPGGPFDLLISVDVLEHIPEADLDGVLADMASLAPHAMLIIDIKPAKNMLPNGDNAHATIKPPEWWAQKLRPHYPYLETFYAYPSRRARFKTWRTAPTRRARIALGALKTLSLYRLKKAFIPERFRSR